jgi:4-hydroxy-3-methylbut-2-enyl diphosphate reductase IspH
VTNPVDPNDLKETVARLKKKGMKLGKMRADSNEQEIEDAERKISSEIYTTEEVVHALERIEILLEKLIEFEENKEEYNESRRV